MESRGSPSQLTPLKGLAFGDFASIFSVSENPEGVQTRKEVVAALVGQALVLKVWVGCEGSGRDVLCPSVGRRGLGFSVVKVAVSRGGGGGGLGHPDGFWRDLG